MKNNECKESLQPLDEVCNHYADLYDNAPVGYLTLDKAGRILEINLTGSKMLNVEYASIIGQPFVDYVGENEIQAFSRYLEQAFKNKDSAVTELEIKDGNKEKRYIWLVHSAVSGETCRMVMIENPPYAKGAKNNIPGLSDNQLLVQNLLKMMEEERRKLARDLHDELGQWLSVICAETELILRATDEDSNLYTSIQEIRECVSKTRDVIQRMLRQLRPPLLDTLGLVDALKELKKQWQLCQPSASLELKLEGELRKFSENINITLFRIIQEALSNICKHAQASQVLVRLSRVQNKDASNNNHENELLLNEADEMLFPFFSPELNANDTLVLIVQDNGKGYHPDQITKGFGLLGMRERAVAVGGTFDISSVLNEGTKIHVRIPLSEDLYCGIDRRSHVDRRSRLDLTGR